MKGLYVHVPFCVRKCAYCDFYSLAGRQNHIGTYIDAVLVEAGTYTSLAFQTMYLGGGTPSLLGPEGLTRLASGLGNVLDLSCLVEATIEVNPESADPNLLQAARDSGINRVSLGVQSLSDPELKSVGRVHTAAQAIKAIASARSAGFSKISTDLILGLPGQTWGTLHPALETLISLGINHLSLYCLSLEPGTPLANNPPANLPSEDTQAELFEQARDLLEDRGFIYYEISNFALSGHECQHNLNYWRGGEYVGLGPSAASHLGGKRFRNCADLEAYLHNPTATTEEVEDLDTRAKAAEEAMLRLRLLREGLPVKDLSRRFGRRNIQGLVQRLDEMAEEGLLIFDASTYRLPRSRVLTSNPIFARVLEDTPSKPTAA